MSALIPVLFSASIVVTVFGYGLTADRQDVLYVVRRPRLLIVSLLAMFVITPVIALALDVFFDFPYAARVALVALSLTPISQLLPRTEIASGGRASYAYGLSFAIALLSIVIVPVMVEFLGRVMRRPFEAPQGTLAVTLLGTVLLPLAVGLAVQRLAPSVARRIREPLVRVANIVLWVALLVLLVSVVPHLSSVIVGSTLAAMVLFVLGGLAVGHLLGGPDPDHAVVLAIACANRNPGLAIGIAALNFPTESFGATMILYGVLVGVVSKPYVNWQKRRLVPASVPSPGGRHGDD